MAGKNKKKILIVDDDPFILELYVVKFEKAGFEVEGVLDAQKALAAAQKFLPNLILLDLAMPNLDGFDLLRLFKKDKVLQKIPVIVLTNRYEQKDQAEKLGADGFLIKAHFTPTEVVTKVKSFLEKRDS